MTKEWLANDTVLRFHGVDSAFDVWVNGEYVGYSKVSRLPSEFDITDYVSEGDNDITVRVYKWSDGTYLEDQDMWWLSGIYRDVELINEPKNAIMDCCVNGVWMLLTEWYFIHGASYEEGRVHRIHGSWKKKASGSQKACLRQRSVMHM